MILKVATRYFIAFAVTAVLLTASDSRAFEQGDRSGSAHQSPETASHAKALSLLSDNPEHDPAKAVQAALQMGDRYKQDRKYADALKAYRQALALQSPPGAVRANALNAIALIYAELYQRDLAMRYFMRAYDQARLHNDLPAQTLALTGLAELYFQMGATEKALDCITQALRLSKDGQADLDPTLLYVKGRICQNQGALENAKSNFEAALAIYRKTDNVAGQVKILCAISTLSLLASAKQAAFEQADQAVELAEKQAKKAVSPADYVTARELRWPAWLSRARAARALGQKEIAIKSYFWAINHFVGIWWEIYIITETSAITFREEAQAAYREYVDLLMEQGQFKQAYELADESKARTLMNFTGARRAKPLSEDSQLAATLREMARTITHLRRQRFTPGLSRAQQAKLQKDLEDAEYQMQETRLQAEMEHSRDRLVWTQLANADQLQKQMARDQMALVEFSLGESRSFVWLFARGELFFEILPARKEIEKAVRSYLDRLAAPPNPLYIERDLVKLREQAAALFATLFGRLSQQIKPEQRLIVVPDGLLHYLPFEALICNGRYLIQDHEISYNPSASMLGLWQNSGSRVESGDKLELLAVGDPVFEPQASAPGRKPSKKTTGNWAQQMLAARGFQLAQLPRTRDEVKDIAGLFPADRRRVFLGSASTEAAIKREPLRRYRRLHLATHSLIDEQSPARSAVVLTPDEGAEEDGLLEVSEIARLDLDCDLVVVSACQTGRGQLLSGEGIVGLSRAFLYAGARAVIVSLWNVSDISTGQLMKNFYQNLTGGQTNAAALRRAKLRMLDSDKETRHPYYWSSFVMVGKP